MNPQGDQQLCRAGNSTTSQKCPEDPTAQQPALHGWNYHADSPNLTRRLCHFSHGEKMSFNVIINFAVNSGIPITQTTDISNKRVLMGISDWNLRQQQDLALKKGLTQQGMPLWQVSLKFSGKSQSVCKEDLVKCLGIKVRIG